MYLYILKKRKDIPGQSKIKYMKPRGKNYFRSITNLKKAEIDPLLKGMLLCNRLPLNIRKIQGEKFKYPKTIYDMKEF